MIINFITKRDDPYKDACLEVMRLCSENIFEGCVAFHSLSIIWYVIRKQESEVKARAWLNAICNMLTVVGASQEQIKYGYLIKKGIFNNHGLWYTVT